MWHCHAIRESPWTQVVVLLNRKWHTNPTPDKITRQVKAWVFGNKPLTHLQWDPGEFHWHNNGIIPASGRIEFFKFTVKLGRAILTVDSSHKPIAERRWESYGITKELRKTIWANPQARKITSFRWLLIHGGLDVGENARGNTILRRCVFYREAVESQYHCLWWCPHA